MWEQDLMVCPLVELEVLLTLRADNKCTLRYLVLHKAFVVDSSGVHKVQSHDLVDLIPLTYP